MQTILKINSKDLNNNFLQVIKSLFRIDIDEIIIKKDKIELEEFDSNLSLNEVTNALKKQNYSRDFVKNIEEGLKNSSVYGS